MTLNIVDRPETAPAWAQTASAGDIERPSDAFISAGWVQSAEPPYRQYFNYVLGSSAQGLKYLLQNGIPKWVSDESYPVDAVIIHDHKMWRAVRDNIGVTPGTSADDWNGVASMITDDQGNPITGGVKEIVAGTNITIEEADGVVTINADDQGGGGGVGKIIAGAGVTVSPVDGTGDVTISATGGGGGVGKIIAGAGVTVSPVDGTGDVTISATGGGGGVGKIIAGAGVTVSPVDGTGEVTISATGGGSGGGVTPPPPPDPDGGVMDYGGWRIMMGKGNTTSGYLDEIDFVAPFDGVFAINITEGNAVGWGAPGAGNSIPEGPSVFGWTRHPTDPNNKFLLSVGLRNGVGDFIYTPGVTFSYIAYGKKPE